MINDNPMTEEKFQKNIGDDKGPDLEKEEPENLKKDTIQLKGEERQKKEIQLESFISDFHPFKQKENGSDKAKQGINKPDKLHKTDGKGDQDKDPRGKQSNHKRKDETLQDKTKKTSKTVPAKKKDDLSEEKEQSDEFETDIVYA